LYTIRWQVLTEYCRVLGGSMGCSWGYLRVLPAFLRGIQGTRWALGEHRVYPRVPVRDWCQGVLAEYPLGVLEAYSVKYHCYRDSRRSRDAINGYSVGSWRSTGKVLGWCWWY
jgi:hypothetical protein